jgi:hypothetical protein
MGSKSFTQSLYNLKCSDNALLKNCLCSVRVRVSVVPLSLQAPMHSVDPLSEAVVEGGPQLTESIIEPDLVPHMEVLSPSCALLAFPASCCW